MKIKYYNNRIALCMAAVISLVGCTRELSEVMPGEDGKGSLKVEVSLPVQTKADYDALAYSTLRVYKVERPVEGEATENLVRKYSPATDMPENLFLVSGEYKITVEAGTEAEATFTEKTYYGEESVILEANKAKTVQVSCKITNIAVKVVFDESVKTAFDDGYCAYVSASDEFSLSDAEDNIVPSLEYGQDATGYFILPEGVSNLSWGFEGSSSDEAIDAKGSKSGIIELPEQGMQYTLTFKYSKDADGFLSMSVQVKEYESVHDDSFIFSPQPTVSGVGMDIGHTVGYVSSPLVFSISSINPLTTIDLNTGDTVFNILVAGEVSSSNEENGITVKKTDDANMTVTLEPVFFNGMYGGVYNYSFHVSDNGGGESDTEMRVAVPGASGMLSSDLWFGTANLGAVFTGDDASSIKIRYREKGTEEWTELDAQPTENEFVYAADAFGFTAGKSYEMQLVKNGIESGMTVTVNTEPGSQVPNSDFEEWHKSGAASYPYAQGGTEFWGTGNPGATSLGESFNLTSESTDVRPGSAGKYSARLETKKPSMFGIGKLAAGNIFVGSFGEISGMGGTVNMGRAFEFNAKPKALRVWYKYTPVGTDKGRIFVALINMTDDKSTSHVVNTNKADNTTFSPDDEFLYVDKTDPATLQGHVIGYGDLMLETQIADWTMVEIPITYREKYSEEKSNVLMITATASYRGDYFEGEVGSLMYLDDIEFVY